jgi:hypothetical protein
VELRSCSSKQQKKINGRCRQQMTLSVLHRKQPSGPRFQMPEQITVGASSSASSNNTDGASSLLIKRQPQQHEHTKKTVHHLFHRLRTNLIRCPLRMAASWRSDLEDQISGLAPTSALLRHAAPCSTRDQPCSASLGAV